MIVLFTGLLFFLYGTLTAHHVYFDLHRQGAEGDIYLKHFAGLCSYFIFIKLWAFLTLVGLMTNKQIEKSARIFILAEVVGDNTNNGERKHQQRRKEM